MRDEALALSGDAPRRSGEEELGMMNRSDVPAIR